MDRWLRSSSLILSYENSFLRRFERVAMLHIDRLTGKLRSECRSLPSEALTCLCAPLYMDFADQRLQTVLLFDEHISALSSSPSHPFFAQQLNLPNPLTSRSTLSKNSHSRLKRPTTMKTTLFLVVHLAVLLVGGANAAPATTLGADKPQDDKCNYCAWGQPCDPTSQGSPAPGQGRTCPPRLFETPRYWWCC